MNIDKVRARMTGVAFEETTMPTSIAQVAADMITDLDVRDDLREGREPFHRIMEAKATVPAGGVLRLRATFEPMPLYMVLARDGFSHWTERIADDHWCVWFFRGDINQVVLDVRGLEPPEPMQRTLEVLEQLTPEQTLVQVNSRVPQFLLPLLEERGYEYVVLDQSADEVRGLIRRTSQTRELDVRIIPPREKHPAIFQTFDSLPVGGAFILINDHDPFPLRYQFQAERAEQFEWEYVERGPIVWRVRIAKVA